MKLIDEPLNASGIGNNISPISSYDSGVQYLTAILRAGVVKIKPMGERSLMNMRVRARIKRVPTPENIINSFIRRIREEHEPHKFMKIKVTTTEMRPAMPTILVVTPY